MTKKNKITKTGFFKNVSGKFRISDPCYNKNVWCTGVLENVAIGLWCGYKIISHEGEWGDRVKELHAYYLGKNKKVSLELDVTKWEQTDITVGVDSGQAGIFDESRYPKGDDTGDYENTESFYGECCEKSKDSSQNNSVGFGIVSTTGYGDGSYECEINQSPRPKDVVWHEPKGKAFFYRTVPSRANALRLSIL